MKKQHPFESIHVKHKKIADQHKTGYRVYSDAKNFVLVQAQTAKEALEKSGVQSAVRVEKQEFIEWSVCDDTMLVDPNQHIKAAVEVAIVTEDDALLLDPPQESSVPA